MHPARAHHGDRRDVRPSMQCGSDEYGSPGNTTAKAIHRVCPESNVPPARPHDTNPPHYPAAGWLSCGHSAASHYQYRSDVPAAHQVTHLRVHACRLSDGPEQGQDAARCPIPPIHAVVASASRR